MGVYKRQDKKSNPWYYRFTINGQSHYEGNFPNRITARRAEIEAERIVIERLSTGTFADLASRRLAHVEAYCTPKHLRDNRAMLRAFELWSTTPLSDIGTKEIQDRMLELLGDGMSNHNVNRHLRALRAVFQMALREGLISRDPTANIPFLPVEKPVKYIPTKADVAEVLLNANPVDQAYITIAWLTAARINEINNLAWEDVNLEEGTLRLWTRKKRHGDKVARAILMVEPVRKALEYMRKHRVRGSPWVFTNRSMVTRYPDKPGKWKYGYRHKLITRLTKKLDKPFTYHNLRHSAASMLAAMNVDLPTIQHILGHESATTTNRYLQSLPQGVITAMGQLERGVADVFN